jgi:hypothetical protein
MGFLLLVTLLFVVLPVVTLLGLTPDSRDGGRWYPSLSDRNQ